LVESRTAWVIRELQESGAHVFALTARYAEMAAITIKALRALGIDFSHSAPFPKGAIRDPDTDSLCEDGVIYTNAHDKGLVLNRFLQHVTFAHLLQGAPGAAPARPMSPCVATPSEIVFIDDRVANCHSIVDGLPCARALGIRIISYHYMPASDESLAREPMPVKPSDTDAVEPTVAANVLNAHIHHFLAGNDPVTDREATRLAALESSSITTVTAAAAVVASASVAIARNATCGTSMSMSTSTSKSSGVIGTTSQPSSPLLTPRFGAASSAVTVPSLRL